MMDSLIGSCFIIPSLTATSKDQAFAEMLDSVVEEGRISKRERTSMKKRLLDREAQGSTGLGNGIAVPHVKTKKLEEQHLVLANSKEGIPFDAIDGQPVHTIFLVMGPAKDPEGHLQALRWISTLARNAER